MQLKRSSVLLFVGFFVCSGSALASTCIEEESADLAQAISNVRAIPVGTPLSPSERTITLAMVAVNPPTPMEQLGLQDAEAVSAEEGEAPIDGQEIRALQKILSERNFDNLSETENETAPQSL